MEKKLQPTLFQEECHANLSPLQEKEKEQKIIVTSGLKCLELLPKSNQDGLLWKMCKALLTSTTAWYSDRCKLIWKHKVYKSNVSLFQLQASVLGTEETEFGSLLPTPTTQEIEHPNMKLTKRGRRLTKDGKDSHSLNLADTVQQMWPTPTQDSATQRKKKYKQGGTPLPLAVKMFPTPTVGCEEGGEQSKRVAQTKSGGFILRKKNKPDSTFGAKLSDAMLYLNKPIVGGKLNPNFVEFLMGFPMNWTKIEQTESKHSETQ